MITNGRDGYHETGSVAVTKTVERVNYVMKVATVAGDVYVLADEARWDWKHGLSVDEREAVPRRAVVWRLIED